MKILTLCLILIISPYALFGQEKNDLAVSGSAGIFNSPYYDKAHAGSFYGLSFDYYLSQRHILTTSYLAGNHNYYDDILSNTTHYIRISDGTNSQVTYNTFSVLYKYKIVNKYKISIVPGIGAGIMTHTREYPYAYDQTTTFNTSSWSDLVFPISLEINYSIFNRWQLGITGGFLIHPDYPVLGLHIGPKFSYIIK